MQFNIRRLSIILLLLILAGVLAWIYMFWLGRPSKQKKPMAKKATPDSTAIDSTRFQAFQSEQAYIALRYPPAFKTYREAVKDTSGWSYSSTKKGRLAIQLKLPRSFQPKTNFSEATFTVGWNGHPAARNQCLHSPQSPAIKTDTVTQNGITYLKSRYWDAGAGNYYYVTRYRTKKYHRCYSLEEMVHSTNIHNYPASRGIAKFDSARVQKMLHAVMRTVRFTK
jgi:hypothetical protein